VKPGSTDAAGADAAVLFIGQIESRSVAIAAFLGHSGFGVMVRTPQLARVDDADDARRDPLWSELPAGLLPWCSDGVASHIALLDISDGLAMQIATKMSRLTRCGSRSSLGNSFDLNQRPPLSLYQLVSQVAG